MTIEDRLASAFRSVRNEETASPEAWMAIRDGLAHRKRKNLLARIGLAVAPFVALGGIGFGTAEVLTPAGPPVHVNVGPPPGSAVPVPPAPASSVGPGTTAPTPAPAAHGRRVPASANKPRPVPARIGTGPSVPPDPGSAPASTTAAGKPSVPPVSTTPAGPAPCLTSNLAVTLGSSDGAAGTTYYDLDFLNKGSATCTLLGYPGVSYVAGDAGTQVGAPAQRDPAISGGSGKTAVSVAPGATVKAVVGELDVHDYPATTCQPTAVRGLRVYPPGERAAAFIQQPTTGCTSASVTQLTVGYVVPSGTPTPAPTTTVPPTTVPPTTVPPPTTAAPSTTTPTANTVPLASVDWSHVNLPDASFCAPNQPMLLQVFDATPAPGVPVALVLATCQANGSPPVGLYVYGPGPTATTPVLQATLVAPTDRWEASGTLAGGTQSLSIDGSSVSLAVGGFSASLPASDPADSPNLRTTLTWAWGPQGYQLTAPEPAHETLPAS